MRQALRPVPSSRPVALVLSVLAVAAAVTACGADESKNKACALSLARVSETLAGDDLEVTYRADMSSECTAVYSENAGRSTIDLAVAAKGAEGMYVKALAVGEKRFDFGEKYSLKNGNLQTRFTSELAKEWAFPWADKPSTASVVVVAPKDTEAGFWPTAVSTEFSAEGD
jgi:hypothetical protein